MAKKVEDKASQFKHYKKWITEEGYTFVAENKEDAELYLKINAKHIGKIKEVKSV
tara:strand:+ start:152 stop:316 length:165 start_codon:yes stop_codon:yes gene_type:complete